MDSYNPLEFSDFRQTDKTSKSLLVGVLNVYALSDLTMAATQAPFVGNYIAREQNSIPIAVSLRSSNLLF